MLDKQFVIIAGKGGVGRTTVATALATILARHGRRTLLAHVRTKQRVDRLLGCAEITETIREVEPNLFVVNMNPRAALREIGLKVLRFKAVYRAVMENRLVKYFLRAIPALDEYSMLGKAWFHTTEMEGDDPKYNTVIFDGPATGHLVTMLRIPQVILDAVPDGPLTADARSVRELLADPARTCIWIVTLAEEMAVSETEDLFRAAREDLQIHAERLVVNALYPDHFEREPDLGEILDQVQQDAPDGDLAPLVAASETIRRRRRINRIHLDQLEQRIPLPRVELPYIFAAEWDRACLDKLAAELEPVVVP